MKISSASPQPKMELDLDAFGQALLSSTSDSTSRRDAALSRARASGAALERGGAQLLRTRQAAHAAVDGVTQCSAATLELDGRRGREVAAGEAAARRAEDECQQLASEVEEKKATFAKARTENSSLRTREAAAAEAELAAKRARVSATRERVGTARAQNDAAQAEHAAATTKAAREEREAREQLNEAKAETAAKRLKLTAASRQLAETQAAVAAIQSDSEIQVLKKRVAELEAQLR